MATLTLTVTYLGMDAAGNYRYEFAVDVNWKGATPHNWIDLYYSLEGAEWGYLFMVNVGTGQIGSATQEYTIGSHIVGQQVDFYAGVPGVITSNQVSIIVGEEEPPIIVGEPIAELLGIRVHDNVLGIWYEVYPEEKPAYCTSGKDAVHVVFGAKNVGAKDGNLWGTLIDNLGVSIIPKTYRWCAIGAFVWWEKTFNMPAKTYPLEIRMGH